MMTGPGRSFDKPIKDIVEHSAKLFSGRGMLMSLWQEIGDQFYPERANFTITRTLGTDFAANLTTSYPLMARRDLGNAFGSMLRPIDKDWFHVKTKDEPIPEDDRKWLEWSTGTMRRAMYDPRTLFTRATSEGDHDFAAFGQCVISLEMAYPATGPQFLYRCWHLRDVAWEENALGIIGTIYRKWKPTARTLKELFPRSMAKQVENAADKEPFTEFNCMHVIIPSEHYEPVAGGKKSHHPFVSLFLDIDNQWVMEETPLPYPFYIIPRWQTVSGSQYSFSPATVAALPDARLIQEMTYTLLNAGQKAVDPPMIAIQEAIRSDVQIFAGGITWADAAYDERLGEVLRPLTQDTSGIPLGREMIMDTRTMIAEAFYLNKLSMPQRGPEMTAYEVGQRIQQYIRDALPLFGPMEADYNGQLCNATFELGLRNGLFGSPRNIPEGLQGQDIEFRFESPLHDAIEEQKVEILGNTCRMVEAVTPYYPLAPRMVQWDGALRDALHGGKTPSAWLLTEEQMLQVEQSAAEEAAVKNLMATVSQGAAIAQQIGQAGEAVNTADGAEMANMAAAAGGAPAQAVAA